MCVYFNKLYVKIRVDRNKQNIEIKELHKYINFLCVCFKPCELHI